MYYRGRIKCKLNKYHQYYTYTLNYIYVYINSVSKEKYKNYYQVLGLYKYFRLTFTAQGKMASLTK